MNPDRCNLGEERRNRGLEEVTVLLFRLKSCAKCGGDLALDEGDWLCLQCGTYYYVNLYSGNKVGHLGRRPQGPDPDSPAQPGAGIPYRPHIKGYAAGAKEGMGGLEQATLAVGLAAVLRGFPAAAP